MKRALDDVKAVIFDMDGTILDSEPLHARAIQTVFKKYNISMTVDEIMNRYIGWGDDNVYKDKTELHNQITHSKFINQKDTELLSLVNEINLEEFKSLFANGFFKLIKHLKDNNILISIVSASARITVDSFMKKAQILDEFDYTLTRDEVYETKPSPACYLMAMRNLGIKTKETIIFEDSHHGLQSALSSGAKVFAIDLSLNDKSTLKTIENHKLQTYGNYSWLI